MGTMPDGGLLALDLNGAGISNDSAVGWSYGLLSWPRPASGRWLLPKIGGRGYRYVSYVNQINDVIEQWKPAECFIELPLPPMAQTQRDTCEKIYALLGFTEEACARGSVKFGGADVHSIRQQVIGRSMWPDNKTKPHIVAFVRNELGMDVADHNEADAVVIWLFRQQQIKGIPSAREPLFRYGMAR